MRLTVARRDARYAAIGLRKPRSSSGPADSASMRPTVSRCAASPMRISPGAAACCRRAATFTASPVAKVESVSSTTTSPASMPTRASRPSVANVIQDPQAGPDGAVGVVLVRDRDAECRHHGVAGELFDRAAVGLDAALDTVEEGGHAAAGDLRILAGHQLVDDTRSANRTVASFRSIRAILGTASSPYRGCESGLQPVRVVAAEIRAVSVLLRVSL